LPIKTSCSRNFSATFPGMPRHIDCSFWMSGTRVTIRSRASGRSVLRRLVLRMRRGDRELAQAQAAVVGWKHSLSVNLKTVGAKTGLGFSGQERVQKHTAAERDLKDSERGAEPLAHRARDFDHRRMKSSSDAGGFD